MTITLTPLRGAAFVLALPAVLLLAGCGPTGPADPRRPATEAAPPASQDGGASAPDSEEVTCQNIAQKMEAIGAKLDNLGERFTKDPQSALGEVQGAMDEIAGLRDATTDPGLRERLDTAWSAGDALLQQLGNSINNGTFFEDLGALTEKSTAFGDSISEVDAYCKAQ